MLESDVAELFTDDDFAFIQRLVEHAAVAIDNARLIQGIEQANRDKTQFISTVAHELKNPMTSIRGYTDLLKGGQVGEVTDMQVQFLGTIRSNVDPDDPPCLRPVRHGADRNRPYAVGDVTHLG